MSWAGRLQSPGVASSCLPPPASFPSQAIPSSSLALLLPLLPLLASASIINNEHLKTEVTHAETCTRKTKAGDKVDVHYRGTLEKDGSEFDASYNRGQPLTFSVGTGQVIKGWDQGLLDMCPGEKRKLTIQPEWAYGARGAGPIPPNSVLSKSCQDNTLQLLLI